MKIFFNHFHWRIPAMITVITYLKKERQDIRFLPPSLYRISISMYRFPMQHMGCTRPVKISINGARCWGQTGSFQKAIWTIIFILSLMTGPATGWSWKTLMVMSPTVRWWSSAEEAMEALLDLSAELSKTKLPSCCLTTPGHQTWKRSSVRSLLYFMTGPINNPNNRCRSYLQNWSARRVCKERWKK